MEDKAIVEMIESVERLGNWAGEKIVELRRVLFRMVKIKRYRDMESDINSFDFQPSKLKTLVVTDHWWSLVYPSQSLHS